MGNENELAKEVADAVREQSGIKAAPSVTRPEGSIVRTFEGDIASAMREKQGSVIKIAVAEEERRRERGELPPLEAPSHSRMPLLISIVFVALGIGVLAGAYWFYVRPPSPSGGSGTTVRKGLIPSDTAKEISLEGASSSKLKDLIGGELRRQDLRLDSIEEVRFTERQAGTDASAEQFFTALGSRIPSVLVRSLRPEFMLGIHAFNGNDPFLILKTDFYENAFLGLLKWENNMALDLFPLFNIPSDEAHRPLFDKSFQDAVIKNVDARVLLDDRGQPALLYAIPDRDTIVITTTADTLSDVISRLSAPSIKN